MDLVWFEVMFSRRKAAYSSIPALNFGLMGWRDYFGSCFENVSRRFRSLLGSFRNAQDKNSATSSLAGKVASLRTISSWATCWGVFEEGLKRRICRYDSLKTTFRGDKIVCVPYAGTWKR